MTTTTPGTTTRAIEASIVACLQAADYPAISEHLAPDAVLDMNLPTWRFQHQGPDDHKAYFAAQLGGFTDLRCTSIRSFSSEHMVMVESECRFTTDGDEYLWRCVDIFDVAGEQVTKHTQYCTGCWTPADIARQAAEAPMIAW